METQHTEHVSQKGERKGFYAFITILAFAIIVLQPLAMLAVIFVQALIQS